MPKPQVTIYVPEKGFTQRTSNSGYIQYDVTETRDYDSHYLILPVADEDGAECKVVKTAAKTEFRKIEFTIARINGRPQPPSAEPKAGEVLLKSVVKSFSPIPSGANTSYGGGSIEGITGYHLFVKRVPSRKLEVDTPDLPFRFA